MRCRFLCFNYHSIIYIFIISVVVTFFINTVRVLNMTFPYVMHYCTVKSDTQVTFFVYLCKKILT